VTATLSDQMTVWKKMQFEFI